MATQPGGGWHLKPCTWCTFLFQIPGALVALTTVRAEEAPPLPKAVEAGSCQAPGSGGAEGTITGFGGQGVKGGGCGEGIGARRLAGSPRALSQPMRLPLGPDLGGSDEETDPALTSRQNSHFNRLGKLTWTEGNGTNSQQSLASFLHQLFLSACPEPWGDGGALFEAPAQFCPWLITIRLPPRLPGRPLLVLPPAAGHCPESPPAAPPPVFPQRASGCPLGFRSSVLPWRRPPRRLPSVSVSVLPSCPLYTCEHHSQLCPYPCASSTSQKLLEERNSVCLA